MSEEFNVTAEHVRRAINDYGWQLMHTGDVLPPEGDESIGWAAIFVFVDVTGIGRTRVPNWLPRWLKMQEHPGEIVL